MARDTDERAAIDPERARQGRIVLTTPLRRAVFIAGLAGMVVVALVLALAA